MVQSYLTIYVVRVRMGEYLMLNKGSKWESQQTFLSTKSARHEVSDNAVPASANLGPDANYIAPRPPGHVRNPRESKNRKFLRLFNLFYPSDCLVASRRPRRLTCLSGDGTVKACAVPNGQVQPRKGTHLSPGLVHPHVGQCRNDVRPFEID